MAQSQSNLQFHSMFNTKNKKVSEEVKSEIKQLDTLEKGNAYVVGNDPEIGELKDYGSNNQIGLVATSCFRGIQLACQLSGSLEKTPLLVILDNSEKVIQYWKLFKEIAEQNADENTFLIKFNSFNSQSNLRRRFPNNNFFTDLNFTTKEGHKVEYLNQDETKFLAGLFKQYGFNAIRDIILSTIVIGQSWADTPTFEKLRDIFKKYEIEDIYVYPSNIVTTISPYDKNKTRETILANIEILNPRLRIHTSYDNTKRPPPADPNQPPIDTVNHVHLVTNENKDAERVKIMAAKP